MKENCEEKDSEKEVILNDLKEGIEHAVHVSNLAYLLGKELGESEEMCLELANAGMVHDIGKLRLTS